MTVIGTCAWNLQEVADAHAAGGAPAVRAYLTRTSTPPADGGQRGSGGGAGRLWHASPRSAG